MTRCSLSAFTDSYINAALWASMDDEGNPLDRSFDRDDISQETLAIMRADCRDFFIENEEHIFCENAPTASDGTGVAGMAGHDFWLTRNGHGAGFWDGDWPEPHATELDEAASDFGPMELYVGDDGKVWGE